jgi:hypothetical protein
MLGNVSDRRSVLPICPKFASAGLLQTNAPSNRSRRAVALAGGLGGHRSGFDGRVTVPALWDKVTAPRAVVGVICVRVSRGLCIQLAFTERNSRHKG